MKRTLFYQYEKLSLINKQKKKMQNSVKYAPFCTEKLANRYMSSCSTKEKLETVGNNWAHRRPQRGKLQAVPLLITVSVLFLQTHVFDLINESGMQFQIPNISCGCYCCLQAQNTSLPSAKKLPPFLRLSEHYSRNLSLSTLVRRPRVSQSLIYLIYPRKVAHTMEVYFEVTVTYRCSKEEKKK